VTPEQERLATGLMARAQEGDGVAYAELLTMLASTARVYARHRLGETPTIDDVVQETLLSVHAARRSYDARRPFAPWFYAILSNRLADARRRARRLASRELPDAPAPERSTLPPVHEVMGFDVASVYAAVDALPARQRAIVRALKLRGESVREVADRMGMSPSAVKVAAHRAYRTLRRLLGEHGT
jgi:RNA polymerase sigma-70 factor (ECF subfamily)